MPRIFCPKAYRSFRSSTSLGMFINTTKGRQSRKDAGPEGLRVLSEDASASFVRGWLESWQTSVSLTVAVGDGGSEDSSKGGGGGVKPWEGAGPLGYL